MVLQKKVSFEISEFGLSLSPGASVKKLILNIRIAKSDNFCQFVNHFE